MDATFAKVTVLHELATGRNTQDNQADIQAHHFEEICDLK